MSAATLAIVLALAGQAPTIEPADSERLAVGDEVVFSPGAVPDAGRVTHIASVENLREMKRLEAFMAHRIVRVPTGPIGAARVPTGGAPIVPVPVGTPGIVEEVAEPGGPTNDARAARVRVADGPLRGRAVWVAARRLGRLGVVSEARTSEGTAPSASAALLARARELEGRGRTEQARGCYRELLERFPDTPEAAEASARLKGSSPPTTPALAPRPG